MGDSEESYQDPSTEDSGAEDTSGDEGSYAEPGAYTNPDGTTGYAGTQSEGTSSYFGEDSGNYDASVGAAVAVGGLGIGLGGEAVFAGMEAAGIISEGVAEAGGQALMGIDMGIEGLHAIFGDD